MFSAGMFAALASAMIVRRRGFMSGSPPPPRAATVNSLMMRVKILPRLASSAPFLCLIDAHLEWPDMSETLPLFGQDDPDIRARVPRVSAIVAEHVLHRKTGAAKPRRHLPDRQRPERQIEPVRRRFTVLPYVISLQKRRQMPAAILMDRFDQREAGAAGRLTAQLHFVAVFTPLRDIGHEIDAERAAALDHSRHRLEGLRKIPLADERLQDSVRGNHHLERA